MYLIRQVVHKRKSPGCGGCSNSCSTTPEKSTLPTASNLVQIEMSCPHRRPSAPPRPADPSLN